MLKILKLHNVAIILVFVIQTSTIHRMKLLNAQNNKNNTESHISKNKDLVDHQLLSEDILSLPGINCK